MYTASNRLPLAVQELAFWWARAYGPRTLPLTRLGWEPPYSACQWLGLVDAWRAVVGDFRIAGVYQRRQDDRPGLTMLLTSDRRPLAIVKVRPDRESLSREQEALAVLTEAGPSAFRVPRPLGLGVVDVGVDASFWSAQSAAFTRPHRPALHAPESVFDEVAKALQPLVDRLPDGSAPAHGDLTPWNLRRGRGGDLWLFDWEDWGLSPIGADQTYYHAAVCGLRRHRMPSGLPIEAVSHWQRIVAARTAEGHDEIKLRTRMLAALEQARGDRT